MKNAAYLCDPFVELLEKLLFYFYKLNLVFVKYKIFKESHCVLNKWFLFKCLLSSEIIWVNLLFCLSILNISYAIPFYLICSALKEQYEL